MFSVRKSATADHNPSVYPDNRSPRGPRRLPIHTRRWSSAALAFTFAAVQAVAQTPAPVAKMVADAHPSFAVATIKPHDPNTNRQTFDAKGDGRIASVYLFFDNLP